MAFARRSARAVTARRRNGGSIEGGAGRQSRFAGAKADHRQNRRQRPKFPMVRHLAKPPPDQDDGFRRDHGGAGGDGGGMIRSAETLN
jgi:hypothetical protein